MKLFKLLVLTAAVSSPAALANTDLTVSQTAHQLNVKNAHIEFSGGRGIYKLVMNVEYGNSCLAADAEDLMIVNKLKNGRTYDLVLASKASDVICTMIYAPVTQTVVLDGLVDPADGVPTVKVNGKRARVTRGHDHDDAIVLDWQAYAREFPVDSAEALLLPIFDGHGSHMELAVNAKATFSNSCHVPEETDLYRLVDYKDNGDLVISVVEKQDEPRACPRIFLPVQVAIEVWNTPVVSGPSAIVVNGKKAL